jgi:GNAT superfamily N-acetyltransferase
MRPGDIERVLDLWEALMQTGQSADPRYVVARDARRIFAGYVREEWTIDKPFPRVLVADLGGIFGFVQGFETRSLGVVDQPRTARIGDLYVDESVRGRGIGRALVEAFVDQARKAGIGGFEVGTLTRDARAVAFWTAMGFAEWQVTLKRA